MTLRQEKGRAGEDAAADWLEKAGCTTDMSSADICEALVAQMTQISYSGLTGKDMTWNAEGQVSKAPTAYVIKDGEYVLPED